MVAVLLTRNFWLPGIGEYLVKSGPPCKADMVVVLAGDFTGLRVTTAGDLVRQGWAPKAMVSGAGYMYGVNEGDLAIQYAVRHGYPADEFINVPSPAKSTTEEATYLIRELRRRGVHRFILVTSNYHTRRAGDVYRKAVQDIPFCVVAAPYPEFSPESWWHDREGQKTVFFEWSKTVAHFFGI